MISLRACLFVLLAAASTAAAEVGVERIPNTELFGLKIGRGGEYFGRVQSINSISLQNYRTAAFRVTELVIDMTGSPLQLRIYHAAPVTPADAPETRASELPGSREARLRTSQIMRRASDEVPLDEMLLFKEYPVTTHAKTIEFTVGSRQDLLDLHEELKNRWVLRPPSTGAGGGARADAAGLHGVVLTVP